jgi:hypothetical protein
MGAARGKAEDEQLPDGSPARIAPKSPGPSRAHPYYLNSIDLSRDAQGPGSVEW